MNVIYIDTSALICKTFQELDYKEIATLLNSADELVSSQLLCAELISVYQREKRDLKEAERELASISLINPDTNLTQELISIFQYGYLRGADAFHLASAMFIDPAALELQFLTRDKQQKKMAEKLGFKTL